MEDDNILGALKSPPPPEQMRWTRSPPLSNYYQKFLDHGVYTHKKEGK